MALTILYTMNLGQNFNIYNRKILEINFNKIANIINELKQKRIYS